MSVLDKNIDRLIEAGSLVEIYRDYINACSDTGVIIGKSAHFIQIGLISDGGLPEGILIIKIEDITRIRWGNNVLNSIEKLKDTKNMIINKLKFDLSTISQIIKSVDKEFGYITAYTYSDKEESCYIGKLEEIDQDNLLLLEYPTLSNIPKRSHLILKLSDLSRIEAGSNYEQDIILLTV